MSPVDRKRHGRERHVRARFWRNLEELADSPDFRATAENEFPGLADELLTGSSRRDFLKMMGAFMSVAGLAGCQWPRDEILPFSGTPEGHVPGVPRFFATASEMGGVALGLVATSFDGRPVKIEGNPLHPSSLGAADLRTQAAVFELFDPDRSREIVHREGEARKTATWEEFVAFAGAHFKELKASKGAGLAILSEASSSTAMAGLRAKMAAILPAATWHEYEPITLDNEREGTRLAFGTPVRPILHLEAASTIACLEADPLGEHPSAVRYARDFADGRKPDAGTMSRLYVAESTVSITGSSADRRLAISSGRVPAVAAGIARALTGAGLAIDVELPAVELSESEQAFVTDVAKDLAASRGQGVIVAGPRQTAEVHALCHLINAALGAPGHAITYAADPAPDRPHHMASIRDLAAKMDAVKTLIILGGNPAYDAPADLKLAEKIARCPVTIRLGLFEDETSHLCRWHIPRAHFLESWGESRGWDGTIAITQPLIEPLYGGKTSAELVALIVEGDGRKAYDLVREHLRPAIGADFERGWKRALHDGVVAGTASAAIGVSAKSELDLSKLSIPAAPSADAIEVVFIPDRKLHDGRFFANPWLQELPDPITTITWDNAALMSPATAGALKVAHGDVVRLSVGGKSIEIAAYVLPGQAAFSIAVALGYGRTVFTDTGSPQRLFRGEIGIRDVAGRTGVDAYALRTTAAPWFASGGAIAKTGGRYLLACSQEHHAIDRVGYEERARRVPELVRSVNLEDYRRNPEILKEEHPEPAVFSLWREREFTGDHQWGMSIDLNSCTGCSACVMACSAENNIPVVGKTQVAKGREMQWIRIDRYFAGDPEAPEVAFQPIACQHCENAPCEQVCPVAATVHTDEGLNAMVYNRCVGTRYCSNNCPYKVRRFNFFNYYHDVEDVEKMRFNPDVTVRSRGVMEKCTYCVQRIQSVKIAAKNEERPIKDGEVVPACAQTCPTQAIVFGDLRDPESKVSKLHANRRAYGMLAELNVKPRTRFLARVKNSVADATAQPAEEGHPAQPAAPAAAGHGGHGEG